MGTLRIVNFDGMIPRTEPHALADTQAQVAQNTKLYAREMRPWLGPTVESSSITASATTIYKLYNYAGASKWLSWAGDVDVALSPQADTGDIRFYYTGDGVPKKSNYALAASGTSPTTYYKMGCPAPVAAPTLTRTIQGTGTNQTRAYIYTFVYTFGTVTEESAPSPATQIDVQPLGSTITLSLFDTPPSTNYNPTAIRIYRSVAGSLTASYQYVDQISLATSTYADTKTVAQLGAALDTLGWAVPPTDMAGIVNLGGGTGVLAGFTGNTVCFSEPFYPHAWPLAYQLTVPFKIVGLSVIGTSVVVMTDRYPYIINGGTPGAMSVERVQILEPCVSKRSIVTMQDGVIYASPNGLVTISSQGSGNIVRSLYHREEWQALVPSAINGGVLEGRYIALFTSGAMLGKGLVLDNSEVPALSTITLSGPSAVHVDSKDAKLYYLNELKTSILQLNADASTPLSYTWRSKKWYLPFATTWSAYQVRGDFTAGSCSIALYADGTLAATLTPTSDAVLRVPAFKCREFFVEITGTRNVQSFTIATSVQELMT